MKKIDIFAIKPDSIDTDWFIDEITSLSKNSIILTWDIEKMEFSYTPSNIIFKINKIKRVKTKISKLNDYLSPLLFLIDRINYFFLFLKISVLYRPEICWVESCYFAFLIGVLRKLGFYKKSIYVTTDLAPIQSVVTSKYSYSHYAFYRLLLLMDYLACKFNDIVLNYVEKMSEVRIKIWGKKITKEERTYKFKIQNKAKYNIYNGQRKSICFLGYMRMDSGLDIVFNSLEKIKKKEDFKIKIIGPPGTYNNSNLSYFKDLVYKKNLLEDVNFLGFIDRKKLAIEVSDCFCGINLLTKTDNPSYHTIPSKNIWYIQFLLPTITTEGAGIMAEIIKENRLGLVIKPTEEEFIEGIFTLYKKYEGYKNNIVNYINKLPDVSLKEFLF